MKTPLMSLNQIVAGISPSLGADTPTAAWNKVITNFQTLDGHTHTQGSGSPITTAALKIDSDLSLNSFGLTGAKFYSTENRNDDETRNFSLYSKNGDLYYRSGTTNIPITVGGTGVNVSSAGGISGLGGTNASATFSSGTFIWQQDTQRFADMSFGSLLLHDSSVTEASPKVITIQTPDDGDIVANYSITLPNSAPNQRQMLITNDTSGSLEWQDGVFNEGGSLNQVSIYAGPDSIEGITLTNNQLLLGSSGAPVSGQLTDSYVSATANISGTKINPDFGSQNTITSGQMNASSSFVNNDSFVGGDLEVDGTTQFDGPLNANAGMTVTGASVLNSSLAVAGTLSANGTTILGNTSAASLSVGARLISGLLPKITNTYSLGTAALRWASGNFQSLLTESASITNLTTTDLTVNDDVILGSSLTDSIQLNGEIVTDITPDAGSSRTLGSSTRKWQNVFSLIGDYVSLSANTFTIKGQGSIQSGTASVNNVSSQLSVLTNRVRYIAVGDTVTITGYFDYSSAQLSPIFRILLPFPRSDSGALNSSHNPNTEALRKDVRVVSESPSHVDCIMYQTNGAGECQFTYSYRR